MLNLYRKFKNERGDIIDCYNVYTHINTINGKRYIGLTKQKPENRWGRNGINYRNKCPHFWNAIQKYGWDSFEHKVLATNLSREEACQLEERLIAEYKTQDRKYGYNTLSGGTAPKLPAEVRQKMSVAMMGNKNGLGHPCSEEKKKKISQANKGKKFSEERKANISKAKAGKSHKSPTEETRKKISDAHQKLPVYCEETRIVYSSIQECARQLALYPTNVCKCCKGKIKSTGGYHLNYYIQDTIQ